MLSKEEVKKIANLARIGLTDEELPKYQKDLSAILDYFKELEKLDIGKIEPIGNITGKSNISRSDIREEKSEEEKVAIIKNAPEIKDNYIKVKSALP